MQSVAPQNRHVLTLTHQFLNVHWDRKKPLLLGYSGGSDSKALLYALLECGVVPHIAHVDHGWREESVHEAESLRKEAEQLGCPFFSTRLNLETKTEDEARKGRFSFFSRLLPDYEALLLAHQADDLAETVLKRILEGAHLSNLGGMQPVSSQYGMTIWRPFLSLSRSVILRFLEDLGLTGWVDSSNSDPTYLRARMRGEIFPFLNRWFGKETVENLTLLAQRAFELREYLDEQVQKVSIQRGPWGVLIDLKETKKIEQRHLLQKVAKEQSLVLPREMLETLLKWVETKEKSKSFLLKTKKIFVDEGRVWFFS